MFIYALISILFDSNYTSFKSKKQLPGACVDLNRDFIKPPKGQLPAVRTVFISFSMVIMSVDA